MKKDPKTLSKYSKEWWIYQIKSFGTALLIVLVIRSCIIESFVIPTGSMIPTLLVGDRIFVNKFAYGLIVPFTDWFFDEPVFLGKQNPPQHGDVIVFKYPRDTSLHFIKRVIGLPGDRIYIDNKVLTINDRKLDLKTLSKPEVIEELDDRYYKKQDLELFDESVLEKDFRHFVIHDRQNTHTSEFPEIKVPEGHLFVMGDNRDFSNDSRFWGYVPISFVRGQALVIWLSLWIDFSKSDYYFRPVRTASLIH